jgi:ribosome modulation factor
MHDVVPADNLTAFGRLPIFVQGYLAGLSGIDACPYRFASYQAAEWEKGRWRAVIVNARRAAR